MKRAVIITNIPAPYRVDFFYYLQTHVKEIEFYVIYSSKNEDNRKWQVEQSRIKNSIFLDSVTVKLKKRYDTRYIHIPKGVKSTLDRLQPDVVIGSEYNPTIIQAVRFCKKRGIPYVSWTDGTLFSERNITKLQKLCRKYVIRSATSYIASSTKSKEAQQFYGAEKNKIHISYLTVDIDKYKQERQPADEKRLLCVGSLIERKGVDLLFHACAQIQQPYRLVVAGQGPEERKLKELAAALGITPQVEFRGHLNQSELLGEYAKSYALILPTREDCYALVILEAMCSGLPTVCSQYADGAYDLIEDKKSGYMVDPYDTKAFKDIIEKLLENPDVAKKMGEQGKKRAEKFCFEYVAYGFLSAIKMALQEG